MSAHPHFSFDFLGGMDCTARGTSTVPRLLLPLKPRRETDSPESFPGSVPPTQRKRHLPESQQGKWLTKIQTAKRVARKSRYFSALTRRSATVVSPFPLRRSTNNQQIVVAINEGIRQRY